MFRRFGELSTAYLTYPMNMSRRSLLSIRSHVQEEPADGRMHIRATRLTKYLLTIYTTHTQQQAAAAAPAHHIELATLICKLYILDG